MWSPEQYERFKEERSLPFWDLVALVEPRPRMRIVDLGCGTGELTRALHEKLGAVETLGIDNSASMLAKAPAAPGLRFERNAIESFEPDRPFDLVFSNAALHWVADHDALFRRLRKMIAEGGQLAVQMPANEHHPSHRIAAEVAQEMGLQQRRSPLLPPERYAEMFYRLGFVRQHVRLQIYGHLLPSSEDVVEWVKGTLLTFYEHQHPRFIDRYREKLLAEIGRQKPYFYTYNRLLLWASLLGENGVEGQHRRH
jgi:trans-aconitate 2-methyltransferase